MVSDNAGTQGVEESFGLFTMSGLCPSDTLEGMANGFLKIFQLSCGIHSQ